MAARCTRLVLATAVLAVLVLSALLASILDHLPWKHPDVVFPDFSRYNQFVQTLPRTLFPAYPHDDRRIIAIGDIHGMNQSLSALLDKVAYNPHSDTLVHLGDIVSKSKNVSPDPLLHFLSTNAILGVRGNNDQKVIEWRAWMDWIVSLPGGQEWLEDMDTHWPRTARHTGFHAGLKKSHKQWNAYIPGGWELLGKHYKMARDMSQTQYDYLASLPLVLYAPTAHTYFVHAGLLPADPTRPLNDPTQPLSHWPVTPNPDDDGHVLRGLQEMALLNQVPQNRDPWAVMNIRSLSKHGKVKDGKKGTPWAEVWNEVMNGCSGLPADRLAMRPLSHCFPSMVLYGHAAARDLDVQRWSVGVDTGCAHGRRLTAIVIDAKSLLPQSHSRESLRQGSYIPYGDGGTAQILSVDCAT